jgi:hypothetical protein
LFPVNFSCTVETQHCNSFDVTVSFETSVTTRPATQPARLLSCSQVPVIASIPIKMSGLITLLHYICMTALILYMYVCLHSSLPSHVFPSCFPSKSLCAFHICHFHVTVLPFSPSYHYTLPLGPCCAQALPVCFYSSALNTRSTVKNAGVLRCNFECDNCYIYRSQWPRGLSPRATPAHLLWSWVRIPCIFVLCVVR